MQNTENANHQEEGFVGRCFVVFGPEQTTDGRQKIRNQGIVRSLLPGDRVLVQCFEWGLGELSTLAVCHLSELQGSFSRKDGEWEFFEDSQHLRYWLENGQGKYHLS